MSDRVRILHLYPRELGINGDRGNVTALQMRARWRGYAVEVEEYEPGGRLPDSVDLVHIGSGPLSSQRSVYGDLTAIAPRLREWSSDGVPFLAIAAGWQLLGVELTVPGGERLAGAGVFPSRAQLGERRIVGEALVQTETVVLAGFENHASTTVLEPGATAVGSVVRGRGNAPGADGDRWEGVRAGSSIGTHLHGSVLPLNPSLADDLLRAALARRGMSAPMPETPETRRADDCAAHARQAISARLGVRERST